MRRVLKTAAYIFMAASILYLLGAVDELERSTEFWPSAMSVIKGTLFVYMSAVLRKVTIK